MTHPLYVPVIDAKGRRYPSIRACARAYGVHRRTVAYHLDTYGNLERLGMGKARINPQHRAKPMNLGAYTWSSRTAAAKDLNLDATTLFRWTRPSATPEMREKLIHALMAFEARQRTAA